MAAKPSTRVELVDVGDGLGGHRLHERSSVRCHRDHPGIGEGDECLANGMRLTPNRVASSS